MNTRTCRSSALRPLRSASTRARAFAVSDMVCDIRARIAGTSTISRVRRRSSSSSVVRSAASASVTTNRSDCSGGSPAGRLRSSASMRGSYSSVRTMSSLVAKYRKTVLGDTSAASAICSIVVASYPCSAISRYVERRIAILVLSFFRSRSPGRGCTSTEVGGEVREVAAMIAIVGHRRMPGPCRRPPVGAGAVACKMAAAFGPRPLRGRRGTALSCGCTPPARCRRSARRTLPGSASGRPRGSRTIGVTGWAV